MLDQQEKDFYNYWKLHRMEKKKWIRQLYVGLPLGVAIVAGVFVNLLSGWYGRAQMVFFSEHRSLIVVLLVASLGIVVFMVLFSARHRWEMNEQRFQEMKLRYNLD
jgi:membrane protein YdbS with pleckstrin-like domain